MSNKTQLQTNNLTLDSYISRINAAKEVAAGLPEAGGGSGGELGKFTVEGRAINGTTLAEYPFLIGQTWSEWVNSTCNYLTPDMLGVGRFEVSGDYISFLSGGGMVLYVSIYSTLSSCVKPTDLIENGKHYMYSLDDGGY